MSSNWLRRLGFCGLFVLASAAGAATAQVTFTKDVAAHPAEEPVKTAIVRCDRPDVAFDI
jgi:hypothetical protein